MEKNKSASQESIGNDARFLDVAQEYRGAAIGGLHKAFKAMVKFIDSRAPAAQAASAEWLSVKDERKPIGRKVILVAVQCVRFGEHEDGTPGEYHSVEVTEGEYVPAFGERDGYFTSYASPQADQEYVSHWQPIPPAPQQEGSEAGNG